MSGMKPRFAVSAALVLTFAAAAAPVPKHRHYSPNSAVLNIHTANANRAIATADTLGPWLRKWTKRLPHAGYEVG